MKRHAITGSLGLLTTTLVLVLAAAAVGSDGLSPANRIIVIVDRSGSFAAHLAEARGIAWRYIRNIGNTSANDEVYVIGVDAAPSQITYIRGVRSRRDAEQEFNAAFARTSEDLGTDWVSALRKAVADFALPPKPAACHLLVFGDLCVDDAKDSATHQLLRRFDRLSQFDWSAFTGVRCSFWFVNDDVRQQLLGMGSVQQLGAQIHSIESRAKAKDLQPPAPVLPTNAQGSGSLGGWLVATLVLVALLALVMRRPARRATQ
jgi:hypothetical protein